MPHCMMWQPSDWDFAIDAARAVVSRIARTCEALSVEVPAVMTSAVKATTTLFEKVERVYDTSALPSSTCRRGQPLFTQISTCSWAD